MNTVTINNTDERKFDSVITWQFDQAPNLCGLITALADIFQATTADFWDDWLSNVTNIDTANDFGLSLFGAILAFPRPTVTVGGTTATISTSLYRTILKARFKLLDGNSSVSDYCEYCNSIFGGDVQVVDGLDMTLSFTDNGLTADTELKELFDNYYDTLFIYPSGVREEVTGVKFFGFDNGTNTDIAPFRGGVFTW